MSEGTANHSSLTLLHVLKVTVSKNIATINKKTPTKHKTIFPIV